MIMNVILRVVPVPYLMACANGIFAPMLKFHVLLMDALLMKTMYVFLELKNL
jgi:hypothetical protein